MHRIQPLMSTLLAAHFLFFDNLVETSCTVFLTGLGNLSGDLNTERETIQFRMPSGIRVVSNIRSCEPSDVDIIPVGIARSNQMTSSDVALIG